MKIKRQTIKNLLAVVLILGSLSMLAYPFASNYLFEHRADSQIAVYQEKVDTQSQEEREKLWQEAVEYNVALRTSHVQLTDPFQAEVLRDKAKNYNALLNVGSSAENMSRGATIIGQTSFPVGGANTNSVIAGHRGYQGIPFFREIEKLEPGDSVFIYGPWETLEYIVSETMVIEPNDIDAVYIQPGRDMVTLITCHPYMSHGRYRYLVYCHRKGEEPTPIPKEYREKEVVFESSEELIQADNLFYYAGGVVILFLLVLLFRKK